jgi:para-nitrobenzyl esterase
MYIPEGAVLEDYLKGGFPPESWADVRQLLASFGSELDQIDTLRSAIQYTCPSLMLAQATEQSGGEAYVYRFDRVRTGFESIGAYHGAELPYVFDTHDPWLPTDAIDRRITNELTMHWVSFLTNGNPSSSTGREWPQWDENQKAMVVSNELSVAAHPDVALCDALRALSLSGVRY